MRGIKEHFLNNLIMKVYDSVDVRVYDKIISTGDLKLKVIIDCSSIELLDESLE